MLFSKQEKVKKIQDNTVLMFLSGFFFRSPQCADDKWTNTVLTESSNDQKIFFISALRVTLRD